MTMNEDDMTPEEKAEDAANRESRIKELMEARDIDRAMAEQIEDLGYKVSLAALDAFAAEMDKVPDNLETYVKQHALIMVGMNAQLTWEANEHLLAITQADDCDCPHCIIRRARYGARPGRTMQ